MTMRQWSARVLRNGKGIHIGQPHEFLETLTQVCRAV
ncbi:hypothetical protein HMPREF9701_00968 [Delftia acidovorans CCUG 274B]|uniref:Uncharacterized protein n=1 Tax=Delftia lacustris TaxID=558537 RepID=A0A1H3P075_9BURK|nr:hypothetical protein HMPREF9701_00968 [Delftia acidovorans CCUG 274B]SDY94507.1 hypothetical protein SAMN05421547_109243 [Delftia lacustris]